jgi:16S rRNA (uracil1498-N3)-methyltransferase
MGNEGEAEIPTGVVTRLFLDAALAADAVVPLTGERVHYLRNVLRRASGDRVGLFNGRDGEWTARIDRLGKAEGTAVVERQIRPQTPEPDLWLVFAPIKKARIDFVAEKATELGVSALWPVFTRYTSVTRVNTDRSRANAVEAAEQTERLSVPRILQPAKLQAAMAAWPGERRLLVCAESGAAQPIAQALEEAARDATAAQGAWAILVGPEGGFAPAELDALRKVATVTRVGLGPRVLRADTAALAALACWQAILGDGSLRPPDRAA